MEFYLLGYNLTQHLQLLNAYSRTLVQGTWRNKRRHISVYLSFCKLHDVDPLDPSLYDILAFIKYLLSCLKTPGSVFNYCHSVKTWFSSIKGSAPLFVCYHVQVFKRGVKKNVIHIVSRTYPLKPTEFSRIITFLKGLRQDAAVFMIALLVSYLTIVRQSNITSLNHCAPRRHTLWSDQVVNLDASLLVCFSRQRLSWLLSLC